MLVHGWLGSDRTGEDTFDQAVERVHTYSDSAENVALDREPSASLERARKQLIAESWRLFHNGRSCSDASALAGSLRLLSWDPPQV
jgi:hypothetical protein